jgi:hypothetical protein
MAKRMVVDTITSGNQKHELGYESVMQSLTAGEPPHEWFRPVVRTTNLDTGKSSEKASQPHYTEKSARDWLKNYASSVKPSTDPLYAEYASNREKISKMMTRLAQARNNPEMRQKLQAESDKLDARQREVAAQLQKRKSSRPGVKAKMSESQSKKYFLGRLDVTIADISEINRMLEKQAKSNSKIKAVSSALNKAESLMVAAESKLMQIDFTRPGAKAKFAMKLEKSFKSPNGAREARVFEYNDMYVVRFFSNGQDLKDDYKTEYQDDAFTTARDFVETYNTGRIQ